MQKRRQINAEPGTERLRSSVAIATEPVRAAAHTVEEQVVWRGSDWARDQADRGADWARDASDRVRTHSEWVRWPFERVAWLFERWVLWPIQERTSISISRQALGAGALGALAIALVAFSVISLGGDRSNPQTVVATAPASSPAPSSGSRDRSAFRTGPEGRDALLRPRQRSRARRFGRRRKRFDRLRYERRHDRPRNRNRRQHLQR